MNFDNKRVLVTGGTRGIGQAITMAFVERGATVAVSYRSDHEAARATLSGMEGDGHVAIDGDLADPNFAAELIDRAVDGLGGLDVVVNNAGTFDAHPIDEVDFAKWQQAWQDIVNLNLHAPANICYHAAQHMMANGGGNIVNISSRGAFRGEPDCPAYGASKAGLNALSQSLAQKLAPHNITVGVVAPGVVNAGMAKAMLQTPRGETIRSQSPYGRVAEADEVAFATLFLASEEAGFSSGTIIDVNGASYLR